ncbi:MAG: helix-turn-helix domain-containing protein [Candidatus Methylomirabilales bacterium]
MSRKDTTRQFGCRLVGLLEAKGWRKADLIARTGLKQASVYEWLRGASEPRGDALSRLARALEVSTDYLLGSDPSYDGMAPAQVAARESLRLCLRDLAIGPSHPEYLLYYELATTDGAPKTVAAWHDLIKKVLPKITEHLRAKPRSPGRDRARRVLQLKAAGIPLTEPHESTS